MRQIGKYSEFIDELHLKLDKGETIFLVGNLDRVMRRLKENGLSNLRAEVMYKETPFNISFDEVDGSYYFSGGERVIFGYKIFIVN